MKLKAGDRVRLRKGVKFKALKENEIYIVNRIPDAYPFCVALRGISGIYSISSFELAPEPKFRVGDKVRLRKDYCTYGLSGAAIYTVADHLPNDSSQIFLKEYNNGYENFSSFTFELAKEDFKVVGAGKSSQLDRLVEEANIGLEALRELKTNPEYNEIVEVSDKKYFESSYPIKGAVTINLKYNRCVRVIKKKTFKGCANIGGYSRDFYADEDVTRIGCKEFKTQELRRALAMILNNVWGSAKMTQLDGGNRRELTVIKDGVKYQGERASWKEIEGINNILIKTFGKYND